MLDVTQLKYLYLNSKPARNGNIKGDTHTQVKHGEMSERQLKAILIR